MDSWTRKYKLKEERPELFKSLVKKKVFGKDEDVEFIRKYFTSDCIEKSIKENAVINYISTEELDRDNEVVVQAGIDTSFFEESGKPVFYNHNHRDLPVAQCMWLKNTEKGWLAKTSFRDDDFSKQVRDCYMEDFTGQGPVLKGWSIGFIPLESREATKKDKELYGEKTRRIYPKIELLEYSAVNLQSNRGALTLAIKKGFITDDKFNEIITKPEPDVTENYIRIRVKDPKLFQKDSFRTIDISKNKGIKAIIGKLKDEITTTTQSFLFEKDKWNVEEAQAWVKEHKKTNEELIDIKEDKKEIDNTGNFKATNIEIVEEKEGRVLSTKNRKLIKTCIDELQKLYGATEGKQEYECECIKCGYKMTSNKHCDTISCPKCSGEMRRASRPGPGKEFVITSSKKPEIAEKKIHEIIDEKSKQNQELFMNELNKIKENMNKVLVNKLGVV